MIPTCRRAAGFRNVQSLKRRIVLHVRRRVAVRDLPCDGALVHVVRRDAAVGRLDQAQALDGRKLSAAATVGNRMRRKVPGGERRRGRWVPRQRNDARVCRRTDIDEARFRVGRAAPPIGAASKTGK